MSAATSLFFLALLVRICFIFFQGSNLEQYLIEDELLYWKNSLDFLNTGELNKDVLNERMPSIFIYYKILLWLTSNSLQYLLYIQAVIDSFSCFIIYKIASLITPRQKLFVYASAVLSPLMIILSSQVLSETIFLFFFTFFLYFTAKVSLEKYNLFVYIIFSGLFLGLATSIRSITFPLMFLSLIPLTVIFINKKVIRLKLCMLLSIFLFTALLPISSRLINNIKIHNSYSLTSQTGTHLAYWIAPTILAESKNINRSEAIQIIKKEKPKYLFTDDAYKNDVLLKKIGLKVLSEISLHKILYLWGKGMIINISSPSILLDKKLRSLPHPSYYEIGDPVKWIRALVQKNTYHDYLMIILLATITSIFSIFSFIIGPIALYKQNRFVFYLSLLYISYFLIITGPVLSPKYIFPILPCIFLYQAITLVKIKEAFYASFKKNKK